MGVAAKIGEFAKKRGISLKELSREVGVPYTTLYHAVKRDSKMEYETVRAVAEVLDVEWYELYENHAVASEKDDDERLARACECLQKGLDALQEKRIQKVRATEQNAWVEAHLTETAKQYGVSEEKLREAAPRYADWEDILGEERCLLAWFHQLNDNGQRVAVERVQELAQIPAYQRPAGTAQSAAGDAVDKDPEEK